MAGDARLKVFLDSNVLIAQGRSLSGPRMDLLKSLIGIGRVELYVVSTTVDEVVKHFTSNELKHVVGLARTHVRHLLREEWGIDFPALTASELRERVWNRHETHFDQALKGLPATVVSVDDVSPSTVLSAYSRGSGIFSGEAKKDQFPDAFIIETIKSFCGDDEPVTVVSSDRDFEVGFKSCKNIDLVRDLEELYVGLDLRIGNEDINAFLENRKDHLLERLQSTLPNMGFWADDVHDTDIYSVSPKSFELGEISDFQAKEGEVLVTGEMTVLADVEYSHPDWDTAAYDSEDKVLIPWDTIEGEREIELSVEFELTLTADERGIPIDIAEFQIEGDGTIIFNLYPADQYH